MKTLKTQKPIVLRVEGLVKKYKNRTVVKGVSFQVHEGEVVGLLGSNGAGKTTSFRMTCGLIPANEGKVWLDGIEVTDWPMYRRAKEGKMGYLPQDRSVFGALTTEKNLYAIMELLKYDRNTQKQRCEELMKKFHLLHLRNTKVGMGGTGGLSGGERRRLEIARALLPHPKILLLDEPFANIDPITVAEIQSVIRDLSAEGIAILITDHQVVETLEITDRSYVIHGGQVLCSGTPDEVLMNKEAQRYYFGEKAAQQRQQVIVQKSNFNDDSVPSSVQQSNASPVQNSAPPQVNEHSQSRGDSQGGAHTSDREKIQTREQTQARERTPNQEEMPTRSNSQDRGFVAKNGLDSLQEYRSGFTVPPTHDTAFSQKYRSPAELVERTLKPHPPRPSLKLNHSSDSPASSSDLDAESEKRGSDASSNSDTPLNTSTQSHPFVSKVDKIFPKK